MSFSKNANQYKYFKNQFQKMFLSVLMTIVFSFAADVQAQTWLSSPGTNVWNTAGNWSSPPAPNAQAALATFSTSATTGISLSSGVSVGTIQFNSGASAFTINTNSNELAFFGTGVIDNSSVPQNLVAGSGGEMDFYNTSTAGDAYLTNNNILNFNNGSTAGTAVVSNQSTGAVSFLNNTTAGSATILNLTNGTIDFNNNSTAGSSTINNAGFIFLNQNATAGSSTITNDFSLEFLGSSTAGTANISNSVSVAFSDNSSAEAATITNGGSVNFFNNSAAGNSTITNASGGGITFNDDSTADNSNIANNGNLYFAGLGNGVSFSTAGSATITNNNTMSFNDYSTAGNSKITNASSGAITFKDDSTAGNSNITNGGNLFFSGQANGVSFSTAGSSTITNNNSLEFNDYSTAGNSQITNSNDLRFLSNSNAGTATIVNNSPGILNFFGNSSAENALITNNNAGLGAFVFSDNATAGNSNITNNGNLGFTGPSVSSFSTAGSATIINNDAMSFNNYATAGNSTITNANTGTLDFSDESTAQNSNITNNGECTFQQSSTAGNSTITTNNGGSIAFDETASGGTVRFIFNGTGYLNISGETTGTAVTVGSIEGSGSVSLGSNNLTTGSNNLNTSYTGIVADGGAGGSLTKIGNGSFTLSGTNTYIGGTEIVGGMLVAANNSAMGAGSVMVNGGTLSLGGPRTLNIGGNYTQTSTSSLQLGLGGTTTGSWDALDIAGSTSLAGTLKLFSYSGFHFHGDETFTIITASNVNGTFNTVLNSTGADSVSVVYNSNDVILDTSAPSFESFGLTVNQKAVGLALDNLAFNSLNPTLIAEISAVLDSSLPSTYDELSPSNLTALYKIRFMDSQVQGGLVWQRLSEIWGDRNSDLSNMAWNGESPMFTGNMPADQEVQIARGIQPDPWGGFLSGMGNFGTVVSDGNGAGYQFSALGTTAGVDYRLAKDLVGGLLIGFDQSGSNQSTGTVNVTGGQVGLYAGWKSNEFHIDALLDGGIDSYSTQRTAFDGTANGTTSGLEYTGQLNLGYDLKAGDFQISPFITGQYTQVSVNSFTETGSLAPLTYGNQGEGYISSDLGSQFSLKLKAGDVQVLPNISAAWEHVYQGYLDSLIANFGTGNNFTVYGSDTGTDAAVLGGGLNIGFPGGVDIYAEYQGELGMTNYTEQSFTGGINVAFGGSKSEKIHAIVNPVATPAATPEVSLPPIQNQPTSPVPSPTVLPMPTPTIVPVETPVVTPVETPFSLGPLVPTESIIEIKTPTATPVPVGSAISPFKSRGM